MTNLADAVADALDSFRIELPSWGFANTGTRFGKFLQPAAAATIEEKFSDAAQVHALTGVCPTLALHVLWDLPDGLRSAPDVAALAARHGIRPGSINPNLFEEQVYKFGSFGNPDAEVRRHALQHTRDSVEIARRLNSRDVVLWFADGSNYPGTANIRQRKRWFEEHLRELHELAPPLAGGQFAQTRGRYTIETAPDLMSRLSRARLTRISFAFLSASIRSSRDRTLGSDMLRSRFSRRDGIALRVTGAARHPLRACHLPERKIAQRVGPPPMAVVA